jgi:hypothetical protein
MNKKPPLAYGVWFLTQYVLVAEECASIARMVIVAVLD